jgi:hypothetical protein
MVDTTSPTVTLSQPPTPSNNTTPSFKGTASATTEVTIRIYEGTKAKGSEVSSATATGTGGSWTSSNAKPLSTGTHTYTAVATQESPLGNPAGRSEPVTFTVNTSAPTVTLNSPPSVSNNAAPAFTGTASDTTTVTVQIYAGPTATGSVVSTVTAPGTGGAWTSSKPSPALKDGLYTATATQSSSLGNPAGVSPLVTFTVDTTAPAVHITTPPNGAELRVSRPTFSGSAGNATGDQQMVTLKIYTGASVSGAPTQTLDIVPSGAKWTTGSSGPQLPDGTYTAQAEQSDDVGNTGTSVSTFKIKTNSPVVTLNTGAFVRRGTKLVTGATPSFSGGAATAPEDSKTVTLNVYSGASTSGSPVRSVDSTLSGSAWTAGPVAALPEGTYTVQAEQKDFDLSGQTGVSASSTFTVDAIPPQVTLTSPANGSSTSSESQLVNGSAGTAEGDGPKMTVQLFSGSAITSGQAPAQSIAVNAVGGAWSATFGGLPPGTYTVRAEQSDDAGNLGISPTSTFVVTRPSTGASVHSPASPAASFAWFPSNPRTGESVSLVSSSTDTASPITAFAWDLGGIGAFATGGPGMSTTFSTPGNHVVQLRVTDANGLSSVAAETIPVSSRPLTLMQPFPIVRITSTRTRSGIKLRLLSVLAPAGAQITVRCKGRACPLKSQSHVAASGKARAAFVEFRRFERSLADGVTLEIRVSKAGEIGKYTRFVVRRGRRPVRLDACLAGAGVKPVVCPSS